jgi:hypothetical protein
MPVYADTSFLASYFLPDANSARALASVQALSAPLLFTALHRLELRNALGLAVFRGRITPSQNQMVWRDITDDLATGLLAATGTNWYAVMRQAAVLSEQHAPTTGCRSLDVLHIATTLKLGTTEFFSFDARQRALAQLVGLVVRP